MKVTFSCKKLRKDVHLCLVYGIAINSREDIDHIKQINYSLKEQMLLCIPIGGTGHRPCSCIDHKLPSFPS